MYKKIPVAILRYNPKHRLWVSVDPIVMAIICNEHPSLTPKPAKSAFIGKITGFRRPISGIDNYNSAFKT